MDVRDYTPSDREACLAVFDSNLEPGFFQSAERPKFAAFLDALPGPYCVLEYDHRIVGCGGYQTEPGGVIARLDWGMILRAVHRQGLGRYLLLYRLKEIGKAPGIQMVQLRTTPKVAPFYAKYAFRPIAQEEQQAGDGLILLQMKLQVCP